MFLKLIIMNDLYSIGILMMMGIVIGKLSDCRCSITADLMVRFLT